MSKLGYYHQPVIWRSQEVAALNTTTTIWTPVTGKRAILTNAVISVYGPNTSTVALYYGADSQSVAPTRIGLFNVSASATVALEFPGLDNQLANQPIRAATTAAPVSIALYGFELDN